MKVLISGSSGLIGSEAVRCFDHRGSIATAYDPTTRVGNHICSVDITLTLALEGCGSTFSSAERNPRT